MEQSVMTHQLLSPQMRLGSRLCSFALLVILFGKASPASAQEPPRLAASIMDVGQPWSVRLRGQPGSSFALLLDTDVSGPRLTRAGVLCLDLGRGLRVLRDGLSRPGPTIPPEGRYVATWLLPNRPDLLGTDCLIQAVVRDDTSATGFATSNCLRRTVGNGSAGDFRRRVVDLPWYYSASDFPLYYAWDVDVGDFDGDGWIDIVVAARRTVAHERRVGGELRLYVNDGRGGFWDATGTPDVGVPIPQDDTNMSSVEAGDVDGDGDLDFATVAGDAVAGRGQSKLYLNDGLGLFTDATHGTDTWMPPESASYYASHFRFADIDRDGDLDMVLDGRPIRIWINENGRGFFRDTEGTPDVRFPERYTSGDLGVADVNGDLALDVLAEFVNEQPALFLNDGRGYFRRPSPEDQAGLPYLEDRMSARDVVFADFDDDGDLDCFIASGPLPGGPSQDRLLINSNGRGLFVDGTFGPSHGLPLRTDLSVGAAAGDIDRDGDLDLVVDAAYEGDQLLLNNASALFQDVSNSTATGLPQIWEVNYEIKLADFDRDGDLDIAMTFTRPLEETPNREGVKILFNE